MEKEGKVATLLFWEKVSREWEKEAGDWREGKDGTLRLEIVEEMREETHLRTI